MKIYLASHSPRRRMLLSKIGLNFQLIQPNYVEKLDDILKPEEYAKRNAIEKAKSVLSEIKEGLIIAADTIVVKDNEILEKPKDEEEAVEMLTKLSGNVHFVYTAVAVVDKNLGKMEVEVEKTTVYMRELGTEEIMRYIQSKEPLDAAGAYKIQEKGAKFIRRIDGCYSNVVGLPVAILVEILKKFDIEV